MSRARRPGVERTDLLGHSGVGDLADERFVGSLGGILGRSLDVEHDKSGDSTVGLPAQRSAHPLHHLAASLRRRENDRQVGFRNIDAFVEHTRGCDRFEFAFGKTSENPSAFRFPHVGMDGGGTDAVQ